MQNQGFASRWRAGLKGLVNSFRLQRRVRSLRVAESLALGEKRSVVIIEFEDRRYLLGATPTSISLLDRLDGGELSHEPPVTDSVAKGAFAAYLHQ